MSKHECNCGGMTEHYGRVRYSDHADDCPAKGLLRLDIATYKND